MMTVASIAMLLSLLTFILLIHKKEMMKSTFLTYLSVAISFYLIGNYIQIAYPSVEASKIGILVSFIGIPFIPTMWMLCVREFCGLRFKDGYTILLFLVVPIILVILTFTWESNHLLISDVHYMNDLNEGNLLIVPGPLYTFRLIYQYAINIYGIVILGISFKNGTKRFRKQAILFLVSTLIPVFTMTSYIVKIGSYNVDITPYGLLISMLLFVVALYRFGVLNFANIVKENAINNLSEGIMLFDNEGIFMDANLSAKEIFPLLDSLSLGSSIFDMDFLPFEGSSLIQNNDKPQNLRECVVEVNGTERTYSISVSRIYYAKKFIGYSVILNNITPLKKLLVSLEEKSIRDPLTNIYNRNYLFDSGTEAIKNAKEQGQNFSVIILDIDYFKNVNDNYGHVYGDYVLKSIGVLCDKNIRKSDVLARYGGEEFCILLPGMSLDGAKKKAENIRKVIAEYKFTLDGVSINLTASFGVADYMPEMKEFLDVVKVADERLYMAKNSGRNRVV